MNLTIKATPTFTRVGSVFKQMNLGAAIQRGIDTMAMDVLGESRKVTPVDTGRLRGSERVDTFKLRAIIAPHTHYATYVHEGTRKMRARPFMRWGLEAALRKKSPVFEEVEKYISAEVRKI